MTIHPLAKAGVTTVIAAAAAAGITATAVHHSLEKKVTPSPTPSPTAIVATSTPVVATSAPVGVTATVEPSASPTASPTPLQSLLTVKDVVVGHKGASGLIMVTGTVTNTDTKAHTAEIVVTMLDKAGNSLGSVTGATPLVRAESSSSIEVDSTQYLANLDHVSVVLANLR